MTLKHVVQIFLPTETWRVTEVSLVLRQTCCRRNKCIIVRSNDDIILKDVKQREAHGNTCPPQMSQVCFSYTLLWIHSRSCAACWWSPRHAHRDVESEISGECCVGVITKFVKSNEQTLHFLICCWPMKPSGTCPSLSGEFLRGCQDTYNNLSPTIAALYLMPVIVFSLNIGQDPKTTPKQR